MPSTIVSSAEVPHRHPILGMAILLACLALPAGGELARRPDERPRQIAAAFSATYSQIGRTCDWQLCHDRRLRKLWELVGDWLAADLEAHPTASGADLTARLKALHAELGGEAVELGGGDFVVTAHIFETGTVFILGRSGEGAARIKWSIDRFAASPTADEKLRCWQVSADCGPLYGSAKLLSATAAGETRFYVDANYAGNGMTVGAQTSVWAWNGREARLLAVDGHLVMIDDDRQIAFDGQTLVVPTKEEPRTFFSCGACPEPAGTWTLRLTPGGAEDLGHRWRDPELQWADELFDALTKGRNTGELAAPAVVGELKPRLEDLSSMLMEWSRADGPPKILSMMLDGVALTFTLELREGHLYATAVVVE